MFTRSYIFIGLNIVRVLSIIGCILVFASSITTLVHDIQAVNAYVDAHKAGSNSTIAAASNTTAPGSSEYIPGSTVPNQPAGAAVSVLNRILILFQVIMIFLSEVGWPQIFFDRFFPILGQDFGLGALGIMQALLGCQILSHFVDTFSLVSAFFLASVGCLNMFLGLIFRQHARPRRSILAWRARAQDLAHDVLPAPVAMAADRFGPSVADKLGSAVFRSEKSDASSMKKEKEGLSGLGFGRQASKTGATPFISRPLETLPRYAASAVASMK